VQAESRPVYCAYPELWIFWSFMETWSWCKKYFKKALLLSELYFKLHRLFESILYYTTDI